jgi:hypothetical protein
MDNAARESGRYGKAGKSKSKKSHKSVPHKDWTKEHAADYLNSDEAKQHAAMAAHAQQLMAQPDPGAQPGAAPAPGGAGPGAMAPQAAMAGNTP